MALGNSDIWLAATTLLGAAVGLLAAGRFVGRRATERRIAGALAGAVAALLVFAMAGTDRLFWAQLAPYSGVVVWGNALLPGVAFAAGLLLSPSLKAIHGPRQRLIAGSLLLCGVAQAVRPFLGDVRRTSDVPVALWQSAVCPQTSEATCSAASAATLLAANDIPATETEMARLCLTRPEGTLMLGAYRGLRLKTVGTSRTVRIFGNISVAELREATHKNPVLISVGIDVWQRGRIDPRYESLWGWTPGKRHAVVLFGFLPNGKLDIGDPSVGREQWSAEALNVLWHGDALQVVLRQAVRTATLAIYFARKDHLMPATLDRPTIATTVSPVRTTHGDRRAALRVPAPHTVADWVTFEGTHDRKHELRNGEFLEMAGATYEHNAITGDFYVELSLAIRGTGCDTLPSDQKVYIENTNGLYPDIVVVCGKPQIGVASALYNPFLVVEVLSPSTAGDDRGEKFEKYRTRPTLRHYLLVEQHRASVEHFERGTNGLWVLAAEHHDLNETLALTIAGATVAVPLAAIYRRVDFAADNSGQGLADAATDAA